MVEKIREVENSLGDGIKDGARYEETENHSFRRSLIAGRDIKKGDILSEEDIIIKRPGYGIMPINYDIVIGRTALVDIKEDEWITWDKV